MTRITVYYTVTQRTCSLCIQYHRMPPKETMNVSVESFTIDQQVCITFYISILFFNTLLSRDLLCIEFGRFCCLRWVVWLRCRFLRLSVRMSGCCFTVFTVLLMFITPKGTKRQKRYREYRYSPLMRAVVPLFAPMTGRQQQQQIDSNNGCVANKARRSSHLPRSESNPTNWTC